MFSDILVFVVMFNLKLLLKIALGNLKFYYWIVRQIIMEYFGELYRRNEIIKNVFI